MKIIMIIVGLFFLNFPLISQSILPDSIVVLFYMGGDYREKGMLGAYDDRDSLILRQKQEDSTYFFSEKSIHIHKIHPYENGKFQKNINENFKLTRNFNLYISTEKIEELISLIDCSQYGRFTLIDSMGVSWDSTKFVLDRDSVYLPKDFSINYFGVDSSFLKNNCEYYFNKFEEEDLYFFPYKTCEYPIDFKKLKEDFIKFGIEDVIHSSYTSFVSVKLKYKDRTIQLYQYDPGGFKTSWWITNNKNKEKVRILNPKINEIISKMLPENFSRIKRLNEYRDIELIYYSYFH